MLETRVVVLVEERAAFFQGHPGVLLRIGKIRRCVLALIPHLSAGMDIEP